MKKLILFVVAIVLLSGCVTLGEKIEEAETDLTKIEDTINALGPVGLIDTEKVEKAKKLLGAVKSAQSIGDKIASEQYLDALLEIMVGLEKYKLEKGE